MNDNHKAIYFSSYEKADVVSVYLSQKYKYKGNITPIFDNLNKVLKDSYVNSFAERLKIRHQKVRTSVRFSRNVQLSGNKNA